MAEIRHRVGPNAPAEDVYKALTTAEGVAQWFWQDARGDSRVSGRIDCFYDDSPMVAWEIVAREPDRVSWRCVQGPEEWMDTTVSYAIDSTSDETVVGMTHAGWRASGWLFADPCEQPRRGGRLG